MMEKDSPPMDEQLAQNSELPNDLVNALNDHFHDQANFIADKSDEVRYHTENYIHSHPWRSVAIAGGVGLFLGLILGRLRR